MKFIKLAGRTYASVLAALFNRSIADCVFPHDLKLADITPVFKKSDSLNKVNYRPIDIYPVVSKLFEKIVASQFLTYFSHLLNSLVSAYRKGYSGQHVLLNLMEYWHKALDAGEYTSSIATDLSKAFDCMPHGLLTGGIHPSESQLLT